MRLKLVEFYDRVRNYVKAIISNLYTLRTIKTIFNSGDRVWPAQCEDAIECLTQMSEQNREFHAFIKRSNHLPLAVVPLRLPLIMALQDADAQIAKLNRLLVVFRNEGWMTLDQPVEQLLGIKVELDILLVKSDKVLEEVRILLDRARFKERVVIPHERSLAMTNNQRGLMKRNSESVQNPGEVSRGIASQATSQLTREVTVIRRQGPVLSPISVIGLLPGLFIQGQGLAFTSLSQPAQQPLNIAPERPFVRIPHSGILPSTGTLGDLQLLPDMLYQSAAITDLAGDLVQYIMAILPLPSTGELGTDVAKLEDASTLAQDASRLRSAVVDRHLTWLDRARLLIEVAIDIGVFAGLFVHNKFVPIAAILLKVSKEFMKFLHEASRINSQARANLRQGPFGTSSLHVAAQFSLYSPAWLSAK